MDVEQLFFEALERPNRQTRLSYLKERCARHPILLHEVMQLLEAHEGAGNFLDQPVLDALQQRDLPSRHRESLLGRQLGRFTLVEVLGHGGMGTVYRGEQQEPIHRQVAIKVVSAQCLTPTALVRFEAEQQVLALLNHPNIAQVLEAGACEGNLHYFVMEWIQGQTITEYCDAHAMALEPRLDLFRQVCEAIHHAHLRGIIHRDLKPSNIMVTIQDGRAVPKIIDFGVAKSFEHSLSRKPYQTDLGSLIGTLEYMSPEQARMDSREVDLRSDVYALGILLFELVTGTTPLDGKTLRSLSVLEALQQICQAELPTASQRLKSLPDLQACAKKRKTAGHSLIQAVRGELDWIIAKALQSDKSMRYRSAIDLADEVKHHLQGRGIVAGPRTWRYRLKKAWSRHRTGLVMAAALLLIVTLGTIGTGIGYWRAHRAAIQAESERLQAEQLSQVLESIFHGIDPFQSPSDLPRELIRSMEHTVGQLEQGKSVHPLSEARLLDTVGMTITRLNEPQRGVELLKQCVALRVEALGEEHPETLSAKHHLCYAMAGAKDFGNAEKLLEEVLVSRSKILGEEHPDTLRTRVSLISCYTYNGKEDRLQANMELFEDAARVERLPPTERLMIYEQQLRGIGRDGFDPTEVCQRCDALIEKAEQLMGPDHPRTLKMLNNLAFTFSIYDHKQEAARYFRLAADGKQRRYGLESYETQLAWVLLGEVLRQVHDSQGETQALIRAAQGVRHAVQPNLEFELKILNRLARTYLERHEREIGLETALEAERKGQGLPPGHFAKVFSTMLVGILTLQGDPQDRGGAERLERVYEPFSRFGNRQIPFSEREAFCKRATELMLAFYADSGDTTKLATWRNRKAD